MPETEPRPEIVTEVQHVKHAYGGGSVPVLTDVSLDLHAGELAVVVGPNGSGKSTFLQVLSGVLDPTGGDVTRPRTTETDGEGDDARPTSNRTVGWLPQRLAPRGAFTVRETIAHYAGFVDGGPSPDDALARVGMAGVADRRVDALSGGMRRLLGVALATVGDPPLLVLDEPTSGLDPTMTRRVFEASASLADEGRAVVVASHDLTAVERTADRAVLLDRGRVVRDEREVASLAARYESAVEADAGTTVREGA